LFPDNAKGVQSGRRWWRRSWLRDIALLYFFSFAQNGRNTERTAVIYLLLLYWLALGAVVRRGPRPARPVGPSVLRWKHGVRGLLALRRQC
jgi:hypothetical protein